MAVFMISELLSKTYSWIRERSFLAAVVFVVLLLVVGVWWIWDEVIERPWVREILYPIPIAKGDKLAIGVADLSGEEGEATKQLILDSLVKAQGAVQGFQVLAIPRLISPGRTGDASDLLAGERAKAMDIIEASEVEILMWGYVRRGSLSLRWTTKSPVDELLELQNYLIPESLELPREFWSHLGDLLAFVVASNSARFLRKTVLRVEPAQAFIERADRLVGSSGLMQQLSPGARFSIRNFLAHGLFRIGTQTSDNSSLERSIEILREEITEWDSQTSEHASLLENTSHVLRRLGARTRRLPYLQEALRNYRLLAERARAGDSLAWWSTRRNLGSVLVAIAERFPHGATLEQAVAAYQESLLAIGPESHPFEWGLSQIGLGMALVALGTRNNDVSRFSLGLRAHEEAVAAFDQDRFPLLWAMAQRGRGEALARIGRNTGDDHALEHAIDAHRLALKKRGRDQVPLLWATSQNDLGVALSHLGERTGETESFAEAEVAFRNALRERDRMHAPFDWSMTQNNLGAALLAQGRLENSSYKVEQAVEHFEQALLERLQETLPYQWAETRFNLATAHMTKGSMEAGIEWIQRAVEGFELVLHTQSRERSPFAWSRTQFNLGTALQILGQRSRNEETLKESLRAYSAAEAETEREQRALDWALLKNGIGGTLLVLGELEREASDTRKAIDAFELALQVATRDSVPKHWAMIQDNLGVALRVLGELDQSLESLRGAVAAHSAVLAERSRRVEPWLWAQTQHHLGKAFLQVGSQSGDAGALTMARQAFESALEVRTRGRDDRAWALSMHGLASTIAALGLGMGRIEDLKVSLAIFDDALSVLTVESSLVDRASTLFEKGRVQRWVAILGGGTEYNCLAIQSHLDVWVMAKEQMPKLGDSVHDVLQESLGGLPDDPETSCPELSSKSRAHLDEFNAFVSGS